jgi:hypothetical protein
MELLYLARSPEASCPINPEVGSHRSLAESVSRRPRLSALAGLRFVAALHIVVHHLADAFARRAVLPAWVTNLVVNGYTSTSLFFILSGFVLAYAYTAREGGFRGARRDFWVGRFARLYPLSLLGHVLVVPLVAYTAAEGVLRAVFVLTATQAWVPWAAFSYNYVAWSVSVLAFFYLAFPYAVAALTTWSSREVAAGAVVMWIAGLIVPALLMVNGHSRSRGEFWTAVHHAFPVVRLPEFLFGVFVGTLFLRHGRDHSRYGGVLTAAGAVLLIAILTRDVPALHPLLHNGGVPLVRVEPRSAAVPAFAGVSAELPPRTRRNMFATGWEWFSTTTSPIPLGRRVSWNAGKARARAGSAGGGDWRVCAATGAAATIAAATASAAEARGLYRSCMITPGRRGRAA